MPRAVLFSRPSLFPTKVLFKPMPLLFQCVSWIEVAVDQELNLALLHLLPGVLPLFKHVLYAARRVVVFRRYLPASFYRSWKQA